MWQKTIGGLGSDILNTLQQTIDGGYILGGLSYSGISGDKTEAVRGGGDYWVVKLNATGVISWQRTLGGNDIENLYSVRQTADSGYVLGGYSRSNISGDKTENCRYNEDYWVIKLNNNGTSAWQKTLGGSSADIPYSVQQTADGAYILGGVSNSHISGEKTSDTRRYQ